MNVLLIGANGYLGPHVIKELAADYHLRITDITPPSPEIRQRFSHHEFRDVDVTSREQVREAARGMDAIVNLSVIRRDPKTAELYNIFSNKR